jgi:hypothetical protein
VRTTEDQPEGEYSVAQKVVIGLKCIAIVTCAGFIISYIVHNLRVEAAQRDLAKWKHTVVSENDNIVEYINVSKDILIVDIGVKERKWWKLSLPARKHFLVSVREEYARFCVRHRLPSNNISIYVDGSGPDITGDLHWFSYARSEPKESVIKYGRGDTRVMMWETGR